MTVLGPAVPGLDVDLVAEWLDRVVPDAEGPMGLNRLGDGKSNLTFLLADAAGRKWVLRRPPLGRLLPSAHDVAREFRVLSSLDGTAVPIPRPIALREADAELEVPLMLMEHVPGLSIDLAGSEELPPSARQGLGPSMTRTLAAIHAVDIEAVGLDGLASHKPYAQRQVKRWRRQFEDSKTAENPLVEELADLLERAAPEQAEVTLVHGDFHLANVIVDPEDGKVRGVLDWELATLGEPLADLGSLLAYWPQTDESVRQDLIGAYAAASGRDVEAIGYWETLAYWKIAIIVEGVLRRRIDEPANGDPAQAAELAEVMLGRATVAAERAGLIS